MLYNDASLYMSTCGYPICAYIEKVSVEYGKHEWEMGIPIVIRFEDLISTFGNNLFEFCFHWTTILFGLQYTFTGSKF